MAQRSRVQGQFKVKVTYLVEKVENGAVFGDGRLDLANRFRDRVLGQLSFDELAEEGVEFDSALRVAGGANRPDAGKDGRALGKEPALTKSSTSGKGFGFGAGTYDHPMLEVLVLGRFLLVLAVLVQQHADPAEHRFDQVAVARRHELLKPDARSDGCLPTGNRGQGRTGGVTLDTWRTW